MSVIYYSVTNYPNSGLTKSHFLCLSSCGSALWTWELSSVEGFACWFLLLAGLFAQPQAAGGWARSWLMKGASAEIAGLFSTRPRCLRGQPGFFTWYRKDSEQAAGQATLEKAKALLEPPLELHLLILYQRKHVAWPRASLRVNVGATTQEWIQGGVIHWRPIM